MNRRLFLALVGALGLSGCGRLEDSGQAPTATTTGKPRSTRTTTTPATTTTTTTTTETTETTTTETTTTETTVSPQEKNAKHIDAARGKLRGAWVTHLDFGDGGGLYRIDARTTDYDSSSIEEQLQDVEAEMNAVSISDATEDQKSMYHNLRVAVRVVRAISKAQTHLIACFQTLEKELNALRNGDVSKASKHASSLSQAASRAKKQHEQAHRSGGKSGFEAIRLVNDGDANTAIRRIGVEARTFQSFKQVNSKLIPGLQKFTEGYGEYHEDYHDAIDLFDAAHERLSSAEGRASFPSKHPSYMDGRIAFITCYIGATKASAEAFERAADYGDEEKSEQRREAEDEAREALEDCEGAAELL